MYQQKYLWVCLVSFRIHHLNTCDNISLLAEEVTQKETAEVIAADSSS